MQTSSQSPLATKRAAPPVFNAASSRLAANVSLPVSRPSITTTMKPTKQQPTATIELITPEWAMKVLEEHEDQISNKVINQRPFSEAVSQGYAIAMQNGHWLLNDQGIMFDPQGRMRDGRHRLWAIVMSGVSVEMLVMRNVPDKVVNGITIQAVDTVDIGRRRDVGQQLAIDGVSNSARMATAARFIARIAEGFPKGRRLSVIQSRQILEIYGLPITKVMDAFRNKGSFCVSYLIAPLAMYRMFSSAMSDQFCEDLYSLHNLPPGSPVIALSKYLSNNTVGGTGAADVHVRAVALTLQHYERGNSVNSIRHSDLGVSWLVEHQKNNVAKIREIVGANFKDHRNT